MAANDKTRIAKPSPIVEDEQGQLVAKKGVSREVIQELSKIKDEPQWMRDLRLKSYDIFERKPIPTWGVDLSGLNLDELVLYSPPEAGRFDSWDDVPEEMKKTYEDLGIPQAEREHLAGVVGVWRQEPVYEGLKKEYADLGGQISGRGRYPSVTYGSHRQDPRSQAQPDPGERAGTARRPEGDLP